MEKKIDFPENFSFEKIDNTIKIKATCREFFQYNEYFEVISLLFILFILPYVMEEYFWQTHFFSDNIKMAISNMTSGHFAFLSCVNIILTLLVCVILLFIIRYFFPDFLQSIFKKNINKTEYFFSSDGIKITFKKNSIFIKKEDIKEIYFKKKYVKRKFLFGKIKKHIKDFYLKHIKPRKTKYIKRKCDKIYRIYLVFKDNLTFKGKFIPNVKKQIKRDKITLFADYVFRNEYAVNYLVANIKHTLWGN